MEKLSVLSSHKWAAPGSPAESSAPELKTAFGVLEFRARVLRYHDLYPSYICPGVGEQFSSEIIPSPPACLCTIESPRFRAGMRSWRIVYPEFMGWVMEFCRRVRGELGGNH